MDEENCVVACRSQQDTQRRKFISLFSSACGKKQKFLAGATIVAQGERLECLYRIVSGHIRSCIYTMDGHRHIFSFRGAGAVIGLGQLSSGEWHASLEAVTSCVLEAVPIAFVEERMLADRDLLSGAMMTLQSEIDQHEKHLLMMAVLPASERVFSFLEAFARQRGSDGFVALPMCRRDIAEYLGLSMETVSRSFSALRDTNRIETLGPEKFRLLEPPRSTVKPGDRHAA